MLVLANISQTSALDEEEERLVRRISGGYPKTSLEKEEERLVRRISGGYPSNGVDLSSSEKRRSIQ